MAAPNVIPLLRRRKGGGGGGSVNHPWPLLLKEGNLAHRTGRRSARPQCSSRGCLADSLSLSRYRDTSRVLGFVFAKCGDFCSCLSQIAVNLRAKRAKYAAFKTVIPFVFKYFLASFPRFFIFSISRASPSAVTHPLSLAARGEPALAYDNMSIK